MKKFCKVILLSILIFTVNVFYFTVFAEENTYKGEKLYSEQAVEIFENTDDEVKELLNSVGIDEITSEKISSISLSDVMSCVLDTFSGALNEPLKALCIALGIIIQTSVGGCFLDEKSTFGSYYEAVGVMFTALPVFSGIVKCVYAASSAVYGASVFLKTLIPVIASVTAASGNPSLAVSYNAAAVYCSEMIAAVCSDFLSPAICAFAATTVCVSLNTHINADRLLAGIKKCVNLVLGFLGTVFTGIMSIKNVLTTSADKVSVKGVKFILGSSVPVIGSSVSEGLSSVIAALSLMKNTFSAAGILILAAMLLPSFCLLLLWMLALSVSSYAASALGQTKTSSMLSSLYFTVSIFFSIILFMFYLAVISTALVVLLSNGAK